MRTDILEQAQAIRAATMAAAAHVTGDSDRLKIRALYLPWAAGEHAVGDIYTANGQVWECIQGYDSAVYPDIVPGASAWGTFHRPLHGTSPDTAMPWVQPTGAHDMYKAGEYMTLDGTLWLCKQGTNFSPAEYAQAWEAVNG